MHSRFRLQISRMLGLHFSVCTNSNILTSGKLFDSSIPIMHNRQIGLDNFTKNYSSTQLVWQNKVENSIDHETLKFRTLLTIHSHRPAEEIVQRLDECKLSLSGDLILNVLKRHRFEWKTALVFFNWVSKTKDLFLDTSIYNEILDTLGRMKQFDELLQVLDEMLRRKVLINERTYAIVVNRFLAGHKVDGAIELFNRMEDLGLERSLVMFQTLLLALCRHKHVEVAEALFRIRKSEFRDDIKTWNIILNGWCLLRSLPDAKRFWKDIVKSGCKPDKFTYGIFINSLSKSGKISTAKELLGMMWEQGCWPDVAICNTVIDGLCFKKRIPEALQIFDDMKARNCQPNTATYNTLIKYMCKIQRMEKVHELLNEMEEKGENCLPNALTYGYLLNASKEFQEVDKVLERMEKSGCKMESDTYNLVLRLFMKWGDEERVKYIWDEMERGGLGPDPRSYTIIIHGLYDKGYTGAALDYYAKMVSKGMVPEPQTELLMEDINFKLNESNRMMGRNITLGNHNPSLKLSKKPGHRN